MTLDELEYITSGSWESKYRESGVYGNKESSQKWDGSEYWNRDIENLDAFKWE